MKQYIKLFEQFILESGNSVENAQPFRQDQVQSTIDWVAKNIFPQIGLVGIDDDCAVLGSAGKKLADQTSGDIDLGVSADKIAGHLGVSLENALFALDAIISPVIFNKLGFLVLMNVSHISLYIL